jgi:hypothetical protein
MHKGDPRGKRSHPKESPHRSASIHRPPVIAGARLRGGPAGSARRAASLVAETLSLARLICPETVWAIISREDWVPPRGPCDLGKSSCDSRTRTEPGNVSTLRR